jgi:NADH-quinone oxidoreductase subunit A
VPYRRSGRPLRWPADRQSSIAKGGEMSGYFGSYAVIGLAVLLGVGFFVVAIVANRLLRPARATREKLLSYECGLDPVGSDWAQTQIRYYVFAFLYLVFAIDSVFLFPWATVFAAPGFGATTLVEMFVFLGFLAVGILYAYRKGVLRWL